MGASDMPEMPRREVIGSIPCASCGSTLELLTGAYTRPSDTRLRSRLEQAERELAAILQEARSWALEAKTQKATVNEVGGALGGRADWTDIAAQVRTALRELARERERSCAWKACAFSLVDSGRADERFRAKWKRAVARYSALFDDTLAAETASAGEAKHRDGCIGLRGAASDAGCCDADPDNASAGEGEGDGRRITE